MNDLTLEDMGMTLDQFKALPKDQLAAIPHDEVWWICGVGECHNRTKVWDYGLGPLYFWPGPAAWVQTDRTFFACGKHWKKYKARIKLGQPISEKIAINHIFNPRTNQRTWTKITNNEIKKT